MFLIVQCHQDEDDVKFLQKILQNFIYEISKNLNHVFIDIIKNMYYSRVWMGDEGSK